MPLYDFHCPSCDLVVVDIYVHHQNIDSHTQSCPACLVPMTLSYTGGSAYRTPHSVHPKERAVVFRNPVTGAVVYPPTNDTPIPQRYKDQGYERHELPSLRSIDSFCSEHGVTSEIAHFDRGTGRGFDDYDPTAPKFTPEQRQLIREGKISIRGVG